MKSREKDYETKEEQLVRIFNSVEMIKFGAYKNGTDRIIYYLLYITMNTITVGEQWKKCS